MRRKTIQYGQQIRIPVSLSEGASGGVFLVRAVFFPSEVADPQTETLRRFLTVVRVQARAAATCRAVVNPEPSQTFTGSGVETQGNSVLFETQAA